MYKSVKDYFEKEYPDLAGALENPGAFWPTVRDNTITDRAIQKEISIAQALGFQNSACYKASLALARARVNNLIQESSVDTEDE